MSITTGTCQKDSAKKEKKGLFPVGHGNFILALKSVHFIFLLHLK